MNNARGLTIAVQILVPLLRAGGFLAFAGGLFYFLIFFFGGDHALALSPTLYAGAGLAAIFMGDALKKRFLTKPIPQDSIPVEASGRSSIVLILNAVLFATGPGAGQIYLGERKKGFVYAGFFLLLPLPAVVLLTHKTNAEENMLYLIAVGLGTAAKI